MNNKDFIFGINKLLLDAQMQQASLKTLVTTLHQAEKFFLSGFQRSCGFFFFVCFRSLRYLFTSNFLHFIFRLYLSPFFSWAKHCLDQFGSTCHRSLLCTQLHSFASNLPLTLSNKRLFYFLTLPLPCYTP